MKVETYPLILGALVILAGLALVLDARLPDRPPRIERRRSRRRERHRGGETFIGLGIVAVGVAILGRDTWRYSILSTLVGAGLLLLGAWLNRGYLRDLVVNRGPARRRPDGERDRPVAGPGRGSDPGV